MTTKPRRGGTMTPREMQTPGSVDWCYQTIDLLKIRYERKAFTEKQWAETLAELERHRAWEKIPPDRPYGSEDELLKAAIGVTRAEGTKVLRAHGGDRKSEDYQGVVNTLIRGSTNAGYLTSRIARDHPAILERMKAGEFPSVRKAALEAGIVRPTVAVPIDPARAARLLVRHFGLEQTKALIVELSRAAGFTLETD